MPGSAAAVATASQASLSFPTADRDSTWNAEANKLVGYWQRQEAIPWVRVHELPAHATFPHMSHVRVGLQCQTCHGPVQEMEKVYKFSSLQMGWCIDCHRGEIPLSGAGAGFGPGAIDLRGEASPALRRAGVDVQGTEASVRTRSRRRTASSVTTRVRARAQVLAVRRVCRL